MSDICPHCDRSHIALSRPLQQTQNFWVVCDVHPLTEGHILIIPKRHLSCVGAYNQKTFSEFKQLYQQVCEFLRQTYSKVSTFEHGVIGQTIFHAHTHLLPYSGNPEDIIPEGSDNFTPISDLSALQLAFKQTGKYLFFSIDQNCWLVNTHLGAPRFFRDRFAQALGRPERGNWKTMQHQSNIMTAAHIDIRNLEIKWHSYVRK